MGIEARQNQSSMTDKKKGDCFYGDIRISDRYCDYDHSRGKQLHDVEVTKKKGD